MRTDKLIALGAFVLLLLIFAALIYMIVGERRRVARAWKEFAQRFGGLPMETDERGWTHVVGTFRDVPVHLQAVGTKNDRCTDLAASCRRPLPSDFALSREGALFGLQRAKRFEGSYSGASRANPISRFLKIVRGLENGA